MVILLKRKKNVGITEEQKEIIVNLSTSKERYFTRREISEKVGVSKTTVYKYQKRLGLL